MADDRLAGGVMVCVLYANTPRPVTRLHKR